MAKIKEERKRKWYVWIGFDIGNHATHSDDIQSLYCCYSIKGERALRNLACEIDPAWF